MRPHPEQLGQQDIYICCSGNQSYKIVRPYAGSALAKGNGGRQEVVGTVAEVLEKSERYR